MVGLPSVRCINPAVDRVERREAPKMVPLWRRFSRQERVTVGLGCLEGKHKKNNEWGRK